MMVRRRSVLKLFGAVAMSLLPVSQVYGKLIVNSKRRNVAVGAMAGDVLSTTSWKQVLDAMKDDEVWNNAKSAGLTGVDVLVDADNPRQGRIIARWTNVDAIREFQKDNPGAFGQLMDRPDLGIASIGSVRVFTQPK